MSSIPYFQPCCVTFQASPSERTYWYNRIPRLPTWESVYYKQLSLFHLLCKIYRYRGSNCYYLHFSVFYLLCFSLLTFFSLLVRFVGFFFYFVYSSLHPPPNFEVTRSITFLLVVVLTFLTCTLHFKFKCNIFIVLSYKSLKHWCPFQSSLSLFSSILVFLCFHCPPPPSLLLYCYFLIQCLFIFLYTEG